MPRHRKHEDFELREIAALEKKLKAYRTWIAAQKEAIEFRQYLRDRRRNLREAAAWRRELRRKKLRR